MRRKRIADYAWEYLKSKGHSFVMHGDCYLLHEIAKYVGLKHNALKTEKNILNALDRAPDRFEKMEVSIPGTSCRYWRSFSILGQEERTKEEDNNGNSV